MLCLVVLEGRKDEILVQARDELHRMLNEDELRGAHLLVLANKQVMFRTPFFWAVSDVESVELDTFQSFTYADANHTTNLFHNRICRKL